MDLELKLNNVNNIEEINDAKANKLVFIPIDKLVPNEKNKNELQIDDSLKDSIKQIGLNVPLDVFEIEDDKYEISSGERRYTAFLSLLRENPDFKYQWKGNQLISPIEKGLPCTVNRRSLSDEDKDLIRLIGNKARDYDNLELYNLFLVADKVYESKKERNEIVWGDGRKVEWLSDYLSISPRTIQKMVEDKWIINSKNYQNIKKCGSYSNYLNNSKDNDIAFKSSKSNEIFNKEYKFLDKVQTHHQKMNFEKMDLREYQIEDLRKNAILTVKTIIERYGIQKKDIF